MHFECSVPRGLKDVGASVSVSWFTVLGDLFALQAAPADSVQAASAGCRPEKIVLCCSCCTVPLKLTLTLVCCSLKPDNLLLDQPMQASLMYEASCHVTLKVADFGLSKIKAKSFVSGVQDLRQAPCMSAERPVLLTA